MLGVSLKLLLKVLITVALEIVLLYPITSMFSTCATFPLEDLFFALYWPGAKWLLYQGVNHFWATFFAVAIPNNLVFYLLALVFIKLQRSLKNNNTVLVYRNRT